MIRLAADEEFAKAAYENDDVFLMPVCEKARIDITAEETAYPKILTQRMAVRVLCIDLQSLDDVGAIMNEKWNAMGVANTLN
eukprot:scaffold7024_cov114-Cylindrotheca_fusiformis.AAC.2